MDAFYLKGNMALINYSMTYYQSESELISSRHFKTVLSNYLDSIQFKKEELYLYLLTSSKSREDIQQDMIYCLKLLMNFEMDEIDHPYLKNPEIFLAIVEDFYQFWRSLNRCSLIYMQNRKDFLRANFIEADSHFNQTVLNFYRTVQQKVQGRSNNVYRQLQPGTNASMALRKYKFNLSEKYAVLSSIPFINMIMLRTPLILHTKSNKREGMFTEVQENPISEFKDAENWMCYPLKVGTLLCYVYFHRDFTFNVLGLANLFELALESECRKRKPDCIVFYGNPDGKKDTVFYYDEAEDCWIGKVSLQEKFSYFGYLKKMILTLQNLAVMKKGWLPIHGAMVNITLKDGRKKGVVLMGDSGAGKSETLETLKNMENDNIKKLEVIFDDMGAMCYENGQVCAVGTEIGAFVRLDDLDKSTSYRDLDRSIFFNPEKTNARVVVPVSTIELVSAKHPVDIFLYANNYTEAHGVHRFEDLEAGKEVFVQGKRFAMSTTQEKGYSTTFFANPFGPMQKKEVCMKLIDDYFISCQKTGVFIGEIYTNLSLENKEEGLKKAAEGLLELIIEE